MSDRRPIPHCAWVIKQVRARKLPSDLRWLAVTIAERVDRHTLQWTSTVAEMMADTGFCRRKVQAMIRQLPSDLFWVRPGYNHHWIITLLRPMADVIEAPDLPDAMAARGAQDAPPGPPRGACCAPQVPLKEESPEGKEERAPQAAPLAPPPPPDDISAAEDAAAGPAACQVPAGGSPDSMLGEGSVAPQPAATQTSARTRKRPFPEDGPTLTAMALLIRAAGFQPERVLQSMADWCADRAHRSADWPAFTRRWIARERRGSSGGKPFKPDRYTQTMDACRAYLARRAGEARP